MKRPILILAAVLALVFAGVVFAQSPQNTTAPGPTQQLEPGQTNNDLPNPGNPQTQVGAHNPTVQEQGTVEGSATESMTGQQGANTAGQVGTAPTTETTTTTETTPTTTTTTETTPTTTTETTTTGTYSGSADTTTSTTNALPSTASDLPTVALIGLLALGAAFVLRYSRRNA
jgi:LPXTG-motif cell wall-anchored protein